MQEKYIPFGMRFRDILCSVVATTNSFATTILRFLLLYQTFNFKVPVLNTSFLTFMKPRLSYLVQFTGNTYCYSIQCYYDSIKEVNNRLLAFGKSRVGTPRHDIQKDRVENTDGNLRSLGSWLRES